MEIAMDELETELDLVGGCVCGGCVCGGGGGVSHLGVSAFFPFLDGTRSNIFFAKGPQ